MGERVVIRVLEPFRRIRPTTNPYIVQLADALSACSDLELLMFSWRRALMGRYDVLHVHWPEILVEGHRRSGRLVRRCLTTLLLLRLWATRTPVVRTVHNIAPPSDLCWIDRAILEGLEGLVRLRIRLNDTTQLPPGAPFATILHGHYREWFSRYPRSEAVPGRIGYVGLIRRYKGVEGLLEAFMRQDDPVTSLHIAGKPSSPALEATVVEASRADPRITAQLAFLDDAEFVTAMTGAELVVLPYRHMHNSGAALAALSLDRPVLVPDNEVNRRLAEEVGRDWVQLYSGDLTPEALVKALVASQSRRETRPDLTRRDWSGAGQAHADVFRLVLGGRTP